jgi:Protein of unknown function (DUF4232)
MTRPAKDIRRLVVGAVAACVATVLSTGLFAGSAVSGTPTAPVAVASCRAASTEVWAAVEGVGSAGRISYELEFSNVGHKTCTLRGYPNVWAVSKSGAQIGVPAAHSRGVQSLVKLRPGATAYVVLGVETTGAVCGTQGVAATGLRVVPPGQTLPKPPGEADEVEHFPLQVCSSQSSMTVLPVHSGTGIPNYSFS